MAIPSLEPISDGLIPNALMDQDYSYCGILDHPTVFGLSLSLIGPSFVHSVSHAAEEERVGDSFMHLLPGEGDWDPLTEMDKHPL